MWVMEKNSVNRMKHFVPNSRTSTTSPATLPVLVQWYVQCQSSWLCSSLPSANEFCGKVIYYTCLSLSSRRGGGGGGLVCVMLWWKGDGKRGMCRPLPSPDTPGSGIQWRSLRPAVRILLECILVLIIKLIQQCLEKIEDRSFGNWVKVVMFWQ